MIVSKRLVEDSEDVLARKVFVTLVKLYPRGYSILNDGNFVKRIYAASDDEAIRQFNELATKGELLTESVKRVIEKPITESKHQTLVESVMSDLDLEVKEAGGKEAWIANVDEQIDDLSHYLNYLKKSAYNEVNRGGNFESTDEVDEAIRNCEKQLGLLKSKKQIIEERKDESVNEALYGMNQIEQFVKMADAIGLKTMSDFKDFMDREGQGKDVITALYDYLHDEIGDLDFHAKDESLKEDAAEDDADVKNLTNLKTIPDEYMSGSDYKGEIIIPNSITSIGEEAFRGCSGITSITIPDSVTRIGKGAFNRCSGIKSITIPDSVKSIGGYAFFRCTGLSSIEIPDSVSSIGDGAFDTCYGLKSVTIGSSVTYLGWGAFKNCYGLRSITIPGSVTSINPEEFQYCDSLTSIDIPNSVTEIGKYAFNGCTKLKNIMYKGTIAEWKDISKWYGWKEEVPESCTIHCTDGDIGLFESSKDESLKEDLAVAVNGEEAPVEAIDTPVVEPVVVEVDTEKQPIEEIQEKISIEQVLSDLIKDEFEAIDGYSSSLATLKILENDGSDYSGIIANLEDIKNEELVHVGQLQKCLAEVNPKAEAIDDGKEEASETIAVAEEESAKGEEPVVEA